MWGGDLIVGDASTSSSGFLSITNGGTVSNLGGTIGNQTGSTGTVTVDGSGSSWTNSNPLTVGSLGIGTLVVTNGGAVSSRQGLVGYSSNSTGTVTVDGSGSRWTIGTNLIVGYASGGSGFLNITNGGVVDVGGGTGRFFIAQIAGSTGVLNIGATRGQSAGAPGTLNAGRVSFGSGAGALVFNHTSIAYDFAPTIDGNGSIGLYGGTTHFTGSLSGYTGAMTVDGGTLHVTSGDTLTLGGSYTQTANGTLKIGIADNTHYGKLRVMGAAALDGTLFIDTSSASGLAAGSLTGIITASSISGKFASVIEHSSLFDFTPVYSVESVDLAVTAAGGSSDSTDSTALRAVTAMGNSPAVGAARVLDDIFQSNPTGEISRAFYSLNGTKAVSDAVAQTLPLMTAGMNQVAVNSLHSTNRVIQSRQDANHGMSSGDQFLGDKKFWLKPVGSWTRQGNRKGVAGYNADTYGLVGGADGSIDEATRIGVAFSYMNSNVDGKSTSSGNSADIDAYQFITYGSHDLASFADTAVNWQADVGLNKNSGRRNISFINRMATSDYDSFAAHVGGGLSRNYQLSESTTVTPGIRADYTWIHDEGYTEKGAGALNLRVNGHSSDELILMAESRLTHKLNDKAALVGNAGVGYDVLHGKNSITSSYVGGGAAFQTQGMDVSPWLGRAGAGMVYNATETTEITARYDLEARSGFLDQTASVKVRWAF